MAAQVSNCTGPHPPRCFGGSSGHGAHLELIVSDEEALVAVDDIQDQALVRVRQRRAVPLAARQRDTN